MGPILGLNLPPLVNQILKQKSPACCVWAIIHPPYVRVWGNLRVNSLNFILQAGWGSLSLAPSGVGNLPLIRIASDFMWVMVGKDAAGHFVNGRDLLIGLST